MKAAGQVVTVCSGWLVCCALCAAQAVPRSRPAAQAADGPIFSRECPASVPPATSESSASGGDYVELERSACAGGCTAYKVRVYGNGEVDWHGAELVETLGDAAGSVSGDAAKSLIQDVAERGFWGLCSRYARGGPAHARATFVTTLSIAGHTKRVEDNAEAAPSWLRSMDLEIDGVANTHLWRHGGPMLETFGSDRLAVDTKMPKQGVTPLMKAATLPDTSELVKTLKLLGDPNQRDSSGWTALMYAAQAGPVQAMTLLLQAGADPNARTNEGETPLFAAVSAPALREERIRALNAAEVDVNARDGRGVTALMLACKSPGSASVIEALLELGADPSKRDDDGHRAVDYWDVANAPDANGTYYELIRKLLVRQP
jgi:hypothetical protein